MEKTFKLFDRVIYTGGEIEYANGFNNIKGRVGFISDITTIGNGVNNIYNIEWDDYPFDINNFPYDCDNCPYSHIVDVNLLDIYNPKNPKLFNLNKLHLWIIERNKFSIGDDVMFVNEVGGTSLHLNGRIGKINEKPNHSIDVNKFLSIPELDANMHQFFIIEWNDPDPMNEDGNYTYVKFECLRKINLKNPEQYALNTWYNAYNRMRKAMNY